MTMRPSLRISIIFTYHFFLLFYIFVIFKVYKTININVSHTRTKLSWSNSKQVLAEISVVGSSSIDDLTVL